jgi:phosphoribosylglycinamide formyltransferase 1
MINLAVFASGNGTNAENLMLYFKDHSTICIHQIITNKENAGVIEKAKALHTPCFYFPNTTFKDKPEIVLNHLKTNHIDVIILAGFLLLFPKIIIEQFSNKIINVHPALLPKYGGKGMYGMHVHNAVIENKESESGISIHYVNEKYDEGAIILQAKCSIAPSDTALDLVKKINALELEYLPKAIEMVFNK